MREDIKVNDRNAVDAVSGTVQKTKNDKKV